MVVVNNGGTWIELQRLHRVRTSEEIDRGHAGFFAIAYLNYGVPIQERLVDPPASSRGTTRKFNSFRGVKWETPMQ